MAINDTLEKWLYTYFGYIISSLENQRMVTGSLVSVPSCKDASINAEGVPLELIDIE